MGWKHCLLSQEELTVKDLRVEVSRQRTLDEKEIIPIRVTADLEFGKSVQDNLASFEGLVADIKKAGFEVSCRIQKIEVEVSLPHVPLME